MDDRERPLVLTTGDPAGVSPEITWKAWSALRSTGPAFVWIGAPAPLEAEAAGALEVVSDLAGASRVFPHALPVLAPADQDDPYAAAAIVRSIETGTRLASSGAASGVVTNPIRKGALADAGAAFAGHTEFVAALTQARPMPGGFSRGPVMLMSGPRIKTALVTIHVPLSEVPALIVRDRVERTIHIVDQSMKRDFGVARPRVLVLGLNPHAGEDGLIGVEDARQIAPAVEAARAAGVDVRGPAPADSAFRAEALGDFDVAVAMYHDQGLIAAKCLEFHETVNVTLGLPIVRTSPDHGVGLDIAGRGIARADSLIAAIRTAAAITASRKRFDAR